MSMQQIIYLAIIFLVVSGVVLVIFFQLSQSEMRGRLQQLGQDVVQPTTAVTNGEPVWVHRMAIWASPLARLSLPEEGWENSQLRIRFMNAG